MKSGLVSQNLPYGKRIELLKFSEPEKFFSIEPKSKIEFSIMPFLFFAVVHFFFHSFIWQLQKEGSLKRKLFAVYIHRLEPLMFRSSRSGVFCKNMFLKISRNSQKSTSVGVSFLVAVSGLRHLGTPTQVFSCEFCVMFKTPVAIENLRLLLRNVRQRCQ